MGRRIQVNDRRDDFAAAIRALAFSEQGVLGMTRPPERGTRLELAMALARLVKASEAVQLSDLNDRLDDQEFAGAVRDAVALLDSIDLATLDAERDRAEAMRGVVEDVKRTLLAIKHLDRSGGGVRRAQQFANAALAALDAAEGKGEKG